MIVTVAAEAGLVDVHDRRPVVFGAAAARDWHDAEARFRANKPHATLEDAQKELARIRWRLLKELQRIGPLTDDRR